MRLDLHPDLRQRSALVLVALALPLLLAGCSVTFRPGTPAPVSVGNANLIVWAQLGLRFSLPGVVVISHRDSEHHHDAVVSSSHSLRHVYDDVDGQMRDDGWRRQSYREEHGRVVAVYVRAGRVAQLTVADEGASGRYRIHIDD